MSTEFTTEELQNILISTHSYKELTNYLKENTIPDSNLSFSFAFQSLLAQHNLKISDVVRNSNLDRTYAYQAINGSRNPSKDKILSLGIAAKLTLKEIQRLLECAGAAILYSRSSRDAVIIYGIENHLSLMCINDMLLEINEKIIQ